MNTKELTYLLQNPTLLTVEHTHSLEKLSKEFPYFQSIRSLVLKGLKDQESFRYNQELKTTAAYTTDRSVLFDFITSSLFDSKTPSLLSEKKNNIDIDVIDPEEVKMLQRISIDDAVTMKIEEAEEVLDPSLFSSKEENTSIDHHTTVAEALINQFEKNKSLSAPEPEESPEQTLEIDKPLEFDKKETHSFSEWLKISSLQPIIRNADEKSIDKNEEPEIVEGDGKLSEQKHKFNLIDEFITNNPKIKPADKSAPTRNLAKEHSPPADEMMTETLAKVYLAQKKYKNAIQAYQILILKNPEKSGFFADQIRAIKKIQENK
ncbi:hypothetical protein [Aquimarina sp. RZ0]|uniref:hypothetical protein n=1 Tax=Aquimarina sp. RZ0 TaxID=2607730 RepID=UPI0011F3FC51|nr:hypothetical protein [Aquimarina sp. RZ0]KAA1246215.1 hypothetical protein F0000_08750 [Aquimarina sp. RZ0]